MSRFPGFASWSNDSDSAFVSMDQNGYPKDDNKNDKNDNSNPKNSNSRFNSHNHRRSTNNKNSTNSNRRSGRRGSHKDDYIEQFRDEYHITESESNQKLNATEKGKANQLLEDDDEDEEEIYIVRQERAYFSYGFSLVQTIIMGLLMWQCGVAPLRINPMFGPYPDALSEWGGKNSYLILEENEWWRIITPILLHAGLLHLFANVAVQVEAGAFFEKEWGSVRWLIIYLGSAVASSVVSVIVMPQAVSVGSSGAVMGLFGGKLAEVILRCAERSETKEQRISEKVRKEQCVSTTCSVVVVMAFSFIPFVDWAAHLGGLLGGLVIGIAVFALELEYLSCKSIWLIFGLALTGGTYFWAIWYMYNGDVEANEELRDVCGYYQEQFEDYECRCMLDEYLHNNGGDNGQDRLF